MAQRRGISTPLLLLVVMSALLFIVLVVDLAQLSIQKQQMQNGADSATEAAVVKLMDRRWLYLGPEGEEPNTHWLSQFPRVQSGAAIQQAQAFAASNQVAGKPIELDEDDVIFGYVVDPTSGQPTMAPASKGGALNSIGIELTRSKLDGNPPVLWLAKQTGLDNIDVVVRSQACVDTRIHGFQPLRRVNVPIVPLGLFEHKGEGHSSSYANSSHHAAGEDEDRPSQIWWAMGPHDHYSVDPRTGRVEYGEDGIAEMVFRLRSENSSQSNAPEGGHDEDKARRSAMIGFHNHHLSVEEFARLAIVGANAHDFAAYGGAITLGDDSPALVRADFSFNSDALSAIHSLLHSELLVGWPRIWPVVADCSSVFGKPTVGIIGFVAGCVVACETEQDGSLLVVIQPCLMQTPTALTSKVAQQNCWIGKLLLVR